MTAPQPPSQLRPDERDLAERLRAGDPQALTEIERRFGSELRLFCRRMLDDPQTAEDVVQDILLTCCRLPEESLPQHSLRGWLYQIARRRCIDIRRRQREHTAPAARAVRRTARSLEHAIDPLTTPSGKALKRDRALKVLELLSKLDDDLRSVIVMQYFQELSREEIAEAIGLSLAGAKARLSRAMQELRRRMQIANDATP
jgi:RNA polymerase sigma-70 factor (ECF subfamily)